MKIGILSVGPRLYSTKRLRMAARERGHTVHVLNTKRFSINIEQELPDLYYKGKAVQDLDAVIPRIGSSITHFGTSVVRQFQQMGVFCANSAPSIVNSRDKLRSLQLLSRYDIGITPTAFVRDRDDILPAINRVGGAPVIIKLLEGTQGVGVILAESIKVAEAIIETLHGAKQNVLIQKFVAESKGKDIRAFVVGDRVVAAMRRVAQGQEFRANIHRGGHAEAIELDPKHERTAVRAAQLLGLRVAGVDMLETSEGPQVIELNSSPGLEGIEKCSGIDVAGAIIEYIEDQVAFPELDIRERLSVSKGYGVAELIIPAGAEITGKAIKDSGLRDLDIVVLTLQKGENTISNPNRSRVLDAGDRVLCFGKLSTMKTLVPERKRRRRQRKPTVTKS